MKDEREKYERPWGWPVKRKVLEGFSPLGSPVHRAVPKLLCACDFLVPLGSSVLAMEDGEVVSVKQDSQFGGNDLRDGRRAEDSDFYYTGNRIEINHGSEEYSAYEHLAFNGSLVKPGDKVKKGDKIAVTGYTGLMAHLGPHLHVERFIWLGPEEEDYTTIKINWEAENLLYTHYLWDLKKWLLVGDSRELKVKNGVHKKS